MNRKRRAASVVLSLLSCAALGCSNGSDSDATDGSGGSSGTGGSGAGGSSAGGAGPADLDVQPLVYTPPELPVELLENGDALELWRAPQGGHVVLIGARVSGLNSNFIELRARIRVPDTRLIVAEETRTVVMEEVAGEPGLKQTDRRSRSQVAHVPLCPDYDERDIVGKEHVLEVQVTELYDDFSFGKTELTVVPTCMQTDAAENALCVCECTGNYTLGRCGAPRDSGTDGTVVDAGD